MVGKSKIGQPVGRAILAPIVMAVFGLVFVHLALSAAANQPDPAVYQVQAGPGHSPGLKTLAAIDSPAKIAGLSPLCHPLNCSGDV